mmetsp:Transcript_24797/g.56877  ORF Transcript_24797/g.56877 Transcript_24797/m.56877 type:complete len:572 (+) Transcript_24797:14-1729(+)|eukprot:CAMPEP_0168723700 /NCGR_PEP_ID=MMETSP0724-20121128/3252_1 /TAXON_ID=265536 /ORGANISM="Amphiprora sp., Strain CCMP467" /LENGTH=571 /DNA_ID=CAMNT_0008770419 /DNA_START=27 /DNA_END=1742 /DNA_ORIENTATION=+
MAQSAGPATSGLFLGGTRESGMDVRIGNVTAVIAVANVLKSSLGPVGLDKMLVDDIGDVTITNDGATILQQLEVEHPAARLLVDLATLQDKEVGDGTTSVVLLAAELVRRGQGLLTTTGLHPTTILSGYRVALKTAISYLKQNLVTPVSKLNDDYFIQAAKTSMSSKILGNLESDFFAKLAVDAVKSVETIKVGGDGKPRYPLSAIHILKCHGSSALESKLLAGGFALSANRAAQGMPTHVEPSGDDKFVKICLLDMNLQRHRMGMGVTLQVTDPQEVERIKKRELDITKEKIQMILKTGAKVVLTTKGMDDVCLKYFVEAGALCARRCNREDLQRLAKATGASLITTLADLEGNESIDVDTQVGLCGSVQEIRVGDGEMLQFLDCQGGQTRKMQQTDSNIVMEQDGNGASTILLRGANEYMLDEMDRALHDALCVVKRLLESKSLVAGGGAVEVALSGYLQEYARTTTETREQLALEEFAQALLVIPKTLAVNAAKDATELTAQLRAAHANKDDEAARNMGLDLFEGVVRDNLQAGVVEPAISKIKSLRFATEAAITILRIDDRITVQEQ